MSAATVRNLESYVLMDYVLFTVDQIRTGTYASKFRHKHQKRIM